MIHVPSMQCLILVFITATHFSHSVEMLNLTRFIKNRLFSIMVNSFFSLLSADCVNIEFTHLNLFQNNHRHLCQVPLLGFPCCHTFHSAFANMHLMDCKFSVSTKNRLISFILTFYLAFGVNFINYLYIVQQDGQRHAQKSVIAHTCFVFIFRHIRAHRCVWVWFFDVLLFLELQKHHKIT